jgi:hypothetical protein
VSDGSTVERFERGVVGMGLHVCFVGAGKGRAGEGCAFGQMDGGIGKASSQC